MFTPPYQRRSLLARWGVELMLSRWRPRAASASHDHGGGLGVVVLLWGGAQEERRGPQGSVVLRRYRMGSMVWCSRDCEHKMTAGPRGARMLHLYWGVHRGMRMRGADGVRIEVPTDHGAWWPPSSS